jgi:hypothetical protein
MDQQSRGLETENGTLPLGDDIRDMGSSPNGTHPNGAHPSSNGLQPIILPRRLPVLDWPAKLYDDASDEPDRADCSSDPRLKIVQRFTLPGARDRRVIRLALR